MLKSQFNRIFSNKSGFTSNYCDVKGSIDNLLKYGYNNLSLRNRILILNVLVLIMSLSVLGYISSSIAGEAIIEKAKKSSKRELQLIDSNLYTVIRGIEDYSKLIASDEKLQELVKGLYQEVHENNGNINKVKVRPEMSRILSNIVSPNTMIIASAVYVDKQLAFSDINIDDYSSPQIISEEFLDAAYEYQKPLWSDLLLLSFSDGTKENVFAVAKLIIEKNYGYKPGIVVLYVNEKDISRIYKESSSNIYDRYYITNSQDMVISSQDKGDLNKKIKDVLAIDSSKFDELTRDGRIITEYDGQMVLISIQNFDKLDWKIISVNYLDEINREVSHIQKLMLIVGIICLVIAFGLSYLTSYTVTKPIQKLTKIMKLIMEGNMNIRAEVEDYSEIGVLTRGFNNLMDRIQDLLNDIVAEQKAKQKFEFKLIQSQIKPHFLYNSLETIISLDKLKRHEEAIQVTKSLANFYRLSLSKGNDIIRISEEIRLINDYLYIQRQRYSNYMDFRLDVDEEILDYFIPKLTLQPLVENAIYHGLKYRNNKGKIEINGYMKDDKITLTVFDDGIGISNEKIQTILNFGPSDKKREDFGLPSVDRRIKLLYGNEYGLKIESEVGSYTKVFVTIPVIKGEGMI